MKFSFSLFAYMLVASATTQVAQGSSGGLRALRDIGDFDDNDDDLMCNTMDPQCGLLPSQAQTKHLHSYDELVNHLYNIEASSNVPIQVGPLIDNGKNDGIFNIDTALIDTGICDNPAMNCDVCGSGTKGIVSIRDAVVCTVTNDPLGFPLRGNTNKWRIGNSNQGREIMAVRMGTGSKRLVVSSQLHGSEAASTEAVLKVIKLLSHGKPQAQKILKELDILFIVRANPDGGDPYGPNFESNYADFLQQKIGLNDNKAFWRFNVDQLAGGALGAIDGNPLSEPGFAGVVGRGYDLNRYNFILLDSAIRPVENQAIVAAFHKFQPHYNFDMHGDVQKSICNLDPSTEIPQSVLGVFPSIECAAPEPAVPTLLNDRETMVEMSLFADNEDTPENTKTVQNLVSKIYDKLEDKFVGHVIRFSQVQTGVGSFNNGLLFRSVIAAFGTISTGLEVTNFGLAARPAPIAITNAGPQIGFEPHVIEPCYLEDNICIHTAWLEEALIATAKQVKKLRKNPSGGGDDDDDEDDNEFCSIPYHHGVVGTFPAALGWGPAAIEDPVQLAGGGQSVFLPADITGICPSDPDYFLDP